MLWMWTNPLLFKSIGDKDDKNFSNEKVKFMKSNYFVVITSAITS